MLLRCREVDLALVKSVLEEAKEEYASKVNVHVPKINIDERVYLPPPPVHDGVHGLFW